LAQFFETRCNVLLLCLLHDCVTVHKWLTPAEDQIGYIQTYGLPQDSPHMTPYKISVCCVCVCRAVAAVEATNATASLKFSPR